SSGAAVLADHAVYGRGVCHPVRLVRRTVTMVANGKLAIAVLPFSIERFMSQPSAQPELPDRDDPAAAAPVDVREKVRSLPTTSGVYLMKDGLGRVIYVGKAVNLRSRVGSYFNSGAAFDRRTRDLVPEIRDLDFVPCDSEVEALLLEARLIKDIRPRFNTELKDDKTFPYLQISTR